jgi:hypothetical protein
VCGWASWTSLQPSCAAQKATTACRLTVVVMLLLMADAASMTELDHHRSIATRHLLSWCRRADLVLTDLRELSPAAIEGLGSSR